MFSSVTEIPACALEFQRQHQGLLMIDGALLGRTTQVLFDQRKVEPRHLSFADLAHAADYSAARRSKKKRAGSRPPFPFEVRPSVLSGRL